MKLNLGGLSSVEWRGRKTQLAHGEEEELGIRNKTTLGGGVEKVERGGKGIPRKNNTGL